MNSSLVNADITHLANNTSISGLNSRLVRKLNNIECVVEQLLSLAYQTPALKFKLDECDESEYILDI